MNKAAFALGLTGLAVGALPFLALAGVLPTAPRAPQDAPGWFGILFGVAFLFAGIMALLRSFGGCDAAGNLLETAPRLVKACNDGFGLLIVIALATMFSWVAFGPGVRHFTVSAGWFSGPAGAVGDGIGRVMFGLGALLGWGMAGAMALYIARRWRRGG
ncbi:MAG TPA: hypothetical protein VGF97_05895 [Rhizomicrobium sp.]|jgi:hypothetical protein